jgi:hypothetical protein
MGSTVQYTTARYGTVQLALRNRSIHVYTHIYILSLSLSLSPSLHLLTNTLSLPCAFLHRVCLLPFYTRLAVARRRLSLSCGLCGAEVRSIRKRRWEYVGITSLLIKEAKVITATQRGTSYII